MSKTNKPNILIVDNSPAITGAYNSIISTTNALQKQFTFYFALPSEHLVSDLSKDGLNAKHIPFLEIQKNWKLILYLPLLILNTYRLQRIIKTQQIDILHVNDLYNMCGVLLKIFNSKIKLVYHIRLLPTSYAKRLYSIWKRLIEKYADEIICVSETVSSNFSKEKTTIVFDAIEESKSIKEDKKSKTNTFTILYLANYVDGKGHRQAIKAYHQAIPKIPKTRLLFYGGTLDKQRNEKFKEYLIKFAQGLGLAESIQFNDFAGQPQEKIANADLMLNFSESESFSMTTLEALVYGIPIVATACGGPSEIIENNKSGVLVPINDIPAMSRAIATLVNDKKLRNSMILEGEKRVLSKFDFNEQVEQLTKVYTRLLNNSQLD